MQYLNTKDSWCHVNCAQEVDAESLLYAGISFHFPQNLTHLMGKQIPISLTLRQFMFTSETWEQAFFPFPLLLANAYLASENNGVIGGEASKGRISWL